MLENQYSIGQGPFIFITYNYFIMFLNLKLDLYIDYLLFENFILMAFDLF
jgi:hypothetical protein